ncbi:MAG: Beta-glucosidase-related glycosidase [Pseudomonadota bacterium]|jgi:beta-glucosidase
MRLIFWILLSCFTIPTLSQAKRSSLSSDKSSFRGEISVPSSLRYKPSKEQQKTEEQIEKKVRALLKKMTIEEKVGQMTQITLDVISNKSENFTPHRIESEKLKEAIQKYHIGSILNVSGDIAFPLGHWHEIITQIQDEALKDRLKIPVLYGIDSVHGAHYTRGATILPQSINIAATWTPRFHREVGRITALETRASGIPWNFYPVLDIGRQFLWSRVFETYGEDVYLAQTMARENILGQQGEDMGSRGRVAACMKHYMGYSYPTSGKDKTPAALSERVLREYFLPPFAAAVNAGAQTVMINTGEIDGIPTHANHHLITDILKDELNFKGFAVSDWIDIKKLYERDHLASSPEEAVKMAIMAGVDMSMVPFDFSFAEILTKLVKKSQIPMSRIDDAVFRILRVKYLLGLFENPYPDQSLITEFASHESSKINRAIAGESITLLKNEKNILPLKKGQKILVTGPTGNSLASLNGGWTISWQGAKESEQPIEKKTVFEALQDNLGEDNVKYLQGTSFNDKKEDYDKAIRAAKSADVVVLCLGEKTYTEIPGNINDLTLDDAQLEFANELYKTGTPVVILLLEGRPRVISSIEPQAKAIVMGYLPGMEGGLAIADVLTGAINPSGKLPYSYPRHPNDLLNYDHKYSESSEDKTYKPQWPFGYGLSYSTFEYSQLELNKTEMSQKGELLVSVLVKNKSNLPAKEVVQLYLSDLYRHSLTPPVKQLKGFEKISLEAGESKKITFKITIDDLAFVGRHEKRIAEPGDFKVQIGTLDSVFSLK